MTLAMHRLAEQAHPAFPVTIYYAFKQSETDSDGGHVQHRLGYISGGGYPCRVRHHWYMADADRAAYRASRQARTHSHLASSSSAGNV